MQALVQGNKLRMGKLFYINSVDSDMFIPLVCYGDWPVLGVGEVAGQVHSRQYLRMAAFSMCTVAGRL
jgi:hypothetical protein